jgi:ribosomal protein S18 acetylase RimI-like enzyme
MSADDMIVDGPLLGQAAVCEPILRALPGWFGIEEATAQYVRDIDALPTFLALTGGEVVGFLTLKRHTAFSAEIHVMGVHPAYHRRGAGRALVCAAEAYLQGQGVEYLQVKTLSDTHPDEGYALTRAFYLAVGFRPLQELPKLWGEENPCLQMVKALTREGA